MGTNTTPDMIPKVSVVIPIYNVERYLDKCVQSVLNQTLTDIEIILVDDGSPDHCGEMCDEYAQQDSRVRVLHKPNGGLSDARNAGIRISRADYVGFVDSDDYVAPDMYDVLYSTIVHESADVAVCGMVNSFLGNETPMYQGMEKRFVTDEERAIELSLENTVSVCNKLFKREQLLQNLFSVECKYGEDAQFIIPYLAKTKKVAFNFSTAYYYVHHSNTITTSSYRAGDSLLIQTWKTLYDFVEENYPRLKEVVASRYYWSMFCVLDKILHVQDAEQARSLKGKKDWVVSQIRSFYFPIMRNRYLRPSRKIAITALMVHEALYKSLLYAQDRRFSRLHE